MIFARLFPASRRPVETVEGLPIVRSASRSHIGRVRMVNEDRLIDRAARGLWAVADGMGGHAGGDVAAQAVVDALRLLAEDPTPIDADRIAAALSSAGRALHAVCQGTGQLSGSTVVALHVEGATGTILWAGDSRAYRLRGGRIERLTRDHSIVQELIDAGALTPEEADRHPKAHVVTRALGVEPNTLIERRTVDVRPDDLYLLCSDGLTRGGEPALVAYGDLPEEEIVERLLAIALAGGGHDNISLVVARIAGD
jgi:serine/threonine-protein phosphatase Stp1